VCDVNDNNGTTERRSSPVVETDCCGITGEYSLDLLHGSAPRYGDQMSPTKPTVELENVECDEKSRNFGLSSGSATVIGHKVNESCQQRSDSSQVVSLALSFASADDTVLGYEETVERTTKLEKEFNIQKTTLKTLKTVLGLITRHLQQGTTKSPTFETKRIAEKLALSSCDVEFKKRRGRPGHEEPRGKIRSKESCEEFGSKVENEENCEDFEEEYEEFKSEVGEHCGRSEIEEVDQARSKDYEESEEKEVLSGHLHTAPSQNELQLNYERGRPTCATQKPSRFRDAEF